MFYLLKWDKNPSIMISQYPRTIGQWGFFSDFGIEVGQVLHHLRLWSLVFAAAAIIAAFVDPMRLGHPLPRHLSSFAGGPGGSTTTPRRHHHHHHSSSSYYCYFYCCCMFSWFLSFRWGDISKGCNFKMNVFQSQWLNPKDKCRCTTYPWDLRGLDLPGQGCHGGTQSWFECLNISNISVEWNTSGTIIFSIQRHPGASLWNDPQRLSWFCGKSFLVNLRVDHDHIMAFSLLRFDMFDIE